jgi:carboxyl-terminal processing protease
LKGLVLDLRNDPGGLLNSAIGVSAAFLKPDTLVVSTDGRIEDAKRKYVAAPEDYLRGTKEDYLKALPEAARTVPLVVLVNGGSASASEIVAGALQDHKRAVIMGTRTFGKGSVQTVLPLADNTALKLTTARYYTPNGRSIQAKGITPDIAVAETANGNAAASRLREADLEGHLSNDKDGADAADKAAAKDDKAGDKAGPKDAPKTKPAKPSKGKSKAGDEGEEDEEARQPVELGSPKDFQLGQAMNLLKGLSIMQNK